MQTSLLTRAANGIFRPNQPQPRTAAEARKFFHHQALADVANQVMASVDRLTQSASSQDNAPNDLNTERGIVVLAPELVYKNALNVRESLNVDAGSGQVAAYEREVKGTVSGAVPRESSPKVLNPKSVAFWDRETYSGAMSDTLSYKNGPLLEIGYDSVYGKSTSNAKFSEHFHLQETEPGVFAMEYELTDKLGLDHFWEFPKE